MRNKNENTLIVITIISVITLIVLLAVQAIWSIKAIDQEEKNFNHLTKIALTKTYNEISTSFPDCCKKTIEPIVCKEGKCETNGTIEEKIDSLVRKNLKNYGANVDYVLTIGPHPGKDINKKEIIVTSEGDSIQFRIEFPKYNRMIIKEMRGAFIVSLIFVIVLSISFLILLKLLRSERKKFKETEDFINNMVHEFQTPISNIQLSTNRLQKKLVSTDDEVNQLISIIKDENNRLKTNTFRILDAQNRNASSKTEVDIHNIIDNCLIKYQNEEPKIIFHKNATKSIIFANEESIHLLINNLLDNAIKYNRDNNEITISTYSNQQELSIFIEDKGIGISKEDYKRIFKKYVRIDNSTIHNIKGFGLGLAIVKQIVNQLNGTIKLESMLGIGSTFTITLPLKS